MNACLCTVLFFWGVEEMNLIVNLIYVLLTNDLFGIDLVQSEVCDYLFSKLNQNVVIHHNVLARRDNQL